MKFEDMIEDPKVLQVFYDAEESDASQTFVSINETKKKKNNQRRRANRQDKKNSKDEKTMKVVINHDLGEQESQEVLVEVQQEDEIKKTKAIFEQAVSTFTQFKADAEKDMKDSKLKEIYIKAVQSIISLCSDVLIKTTDLDFLKKISELVSFDKLNSISNDKDIKVFPVDISKDIVVRDFLNCFTAIDDLVKEVDKCYGNNFEEKMVNFMEKSKKDRYTNIAHEFTCEFMDILPITSLLRRK